jgi:predicted nucleotidyltransferase
MRLADSATGVIRETAERVFGPGVEVWLFGSRVDDAARGGDIDLLVVPATPPASRARSSAEFAAALQWHLGDQRIDVIVDDGSGRSPIAERARATGRRLM